MDVKQFVNRLKDAAINYKTLYVMGCFGSPMNAANKTRYKNNHSYNKAAARQKFIDAATADTFGFDCVCLIKGVLWGWDGDKSKTYGGASYNSNGVPDINADTMINRCKNLSTDFSNIEIGEAVWITGHIGVYIGNGLVVECTPKWTNDVQITALLNIGPKAGYNGRTWTKHGKLPYVNYQGIQVEPKPSNKSNDAIAQEVLDGKWGNGDERKKKLEAAGYNYSTIQGLVNNLVKQPSVKKSNSDIAKEVLAGKWGNGDERKQNLTKAGYNYSAVQAEVNKLVNQTKEKEINTVAKEVIQGKWGNGADRKKRLEAAGYNYSEIQKEVNKLLK